MAQEAKKDDSPLSGQSFTGLWKLKGEKNLEGHLVEIGHSKDEAASLKELSLSYVFDLIACTDTTFHLRRDYKLSKDEDSKLLRFDLLLDGKTKAKVSNHRGDEFEITGVWGNKKQSIVITAANKDGENVFKQTLTIDQGGNFVETTVNIKTKGTRVLTFGRAMTTN